MRATADEVLESSFRRPGLLGWLLLAPLILWLLLFVLTPTLMMVGFSFVRTDLYNKPLPGWTVENYVRLADPVYVGILLQSCWYAFLTTLLCLLMGYPVAYCIGRAPSRWRNLLLLLVMIPFWTSFLIRTYAWFQILATKGLLNAALLKIGVIHQPLTLQYTEFSVILGLVYNYLPFMVLPIYGSVEKLDRSLVEAAQDLGANSVRAFTKVVLPLTMPGVIAGGLLVFVPALGMFAITTLMGGGRIVMLGNVIQNQFLGQARNMAFGCALGTVLLAIFLLALWIGLGRRKEAFH